MPTVPILQQSVQATTDASAWTSLGGGLYQTTVAATLISPALGNTIVVEAILATLDPTLSSGDIAGYTVTFSDGLSYDDPSGGAGTFTVAGNVNSLHLLFAAFIDPSFAPPGNVTVTLNINANGIPASPLLLAMVCSEYSNLKDSFGRIGLQDVVGGAVAGASLGITDGYGGTQPGDNFYVAFGVAVNQTADALASSPFVTQKSGTGLPSTSSSVYADYYNSAGESVTFTAGGSSPDYAIAGTIGAFDIVCACDLEASEYTFAPGDAVTLSWTTNPYTLTASIDNGIGSVALNGSMVVHPVANITYTLSVTGPNGSTDTSSVTLTAGAPACTLTITGIPASGLPSWQANASYQQAGVNSYGSVIVDPNGNYQGILAGGGGISGPSIPPTWGTAPGATTPDGTATWTCIVPLDSSLNALPYVRAVVKLGTKVGLSWSSTLGTSATLSGGIGTVPLNGSGDYQPGLSQFGTTEIYLGIPTVYPAALTITAAAQYILTVTGPGGTTTSTVYFLIYDPIVATPITCFAPVNLAVNGSYGGTAGGGPAVPPPFPAWSAGASYNQGVQIVDSNGNGQVALNVGTAATTAPAWAGLGLTTTETTGLQWQNTGKVYPGTVVQTEFGPLGGSSSTLGFGFENMVIPSFITTPPAYAPSTGYTPGQIVSILSGSAYYIGTGLQLLQCLQAGATGATPLGSILVLPYQTPGEIFTDNAMNTGGTVVWKVLGSLLITLNWMGTEINAPDGYPAPGSPFGTGNIPQVFDGTVQTFPLNSASLVTGFLATPAGQDTTTYMFNTVGIPPAGVPLECPHWISIITATGYINIACVPGATINIAGVWAEFSYPLAPLPPSTGTITVVKATLPPGSPQSFSFTGDLGSFSLTDGQSYGSGALAPGTYSVAETAVAGWVTVTSQDPSAIVLGAGENLSITFTNTQVPPIPARVLPYLKIPKGQGQTVDELNGQSSISSLDVECIDPSNELKYLATKPTIVGAMAYLKMGFEGMNLSDFIPLHVVQISDVGRTPEGWIKFGCRDNLALLDRALWYCGGPQPVALPWLYGQAYLAGQYVQDSNGNIQQCIVAGTTSRTTPPVWPGTTAPVWQPNTSYTLGYWAIDNLHGNLQAVTTVPSGHTSTRPLNTGVSGNGFPNPSWSSVVGGITLDNSGGNVNGPISWTCIAINNILGEQVTDGGVTWQLVAFPYRGAFGGSQAFYVYNLFGQTVQVPEPPPRTAFTSNQFPTLDGNPRYIYGNPIDAMLVALQNELGLGQNPLLPPIVTTDPNDPQNALVFAPNPAWQQYVPGNDSTLINPNPFINLTNILSIRDNEVSGRKFEWVVKRPVTAKSWIQDEILKPLGLYMYTHNDGTIDLKSMKSPLIVTPVMIDDNTTKSTPDQSRIAVLNVVTTRGDVNDLGAYSAARVYNAEMTFVQKLSLQTYQQEFAHSIESNGMREAYDSYGVGYLLADRIFRRHGFSTPSYDLELFLGSVRLELGDFILLSNKLMLDFASKTGRTGIFKVLCEVVDRQPNYANGSIKLTVLDCRFMGLTTPYEIAPLAAAVPNWTMQTPAQRKQFMTISYWPGVYSTAEPGHGIF